MSSFPTLKYNSNSSYFYLILLVLYFAIAFWLWYENQQHQAQEKQRIRSQAQVIIETLASSVRALSRIILYHPERLQKIFDEAILPDTINALALFDHEGEIIVQSGDQTKLSPPSSLSAHSLPETWKDCSLQLWSIVSIGKIYHKKHKKLKKYHFPTDLLRKLRKKKPKYPPHSRFVLTISLSTKSIAGNIRAGKQLRLLIALLSFFFLAFVGYFWHHSMKGLELKTSLEMEKRRSQHLYEMNLAANGLAHETKNPLNSLRLLAQTLAEDNPGLRNKLDPIADEVDRLSSRINEWLAFSRQPDPHLEPIELEQLFLELNQLLSIDLEEKNISLILPTFSIRVWADWEMLRQLLFNLLLNATQAIEQNGLLWICIEHKNYEVDILVEDNGPGVAKQDQKRLFTPYFTTKQEGSGLGLAICRQIALAHSWQVHYEDRPEKGARFVISRIRAVKTS